MARILAGWLVVMASLAQAQVQEPSTPPTVVVPLAEDQPAETVEYTEDGRILLGKERRQLTAVELFQLAGRPDLIQRAEANVRLRRGLLIGAGVLAALSIALGATMYATIPPISGQTPCNTGDNVLFNYYCQPKNSLHNWVAAVSLIGGIGISGAIATLGLVLRPDVLSPIKLQELIDGYNASLVKPGGLKLVPWASPDGAGLLAQARF